MTRRPVRVSLMGAPPVTVAPPVVPDGTAADALPAGATIGTVGGADAHGRRTVEVVVDGWRFEAVVEDAARAELRERASRDRGAGSSVGGPLEIRAIIPGRVVEVRVNAGDTVEQGQALLVVEAMKMQNELRSPRAGTVERVAASAGATVEVGDVLVVLG
ncbi:MAG: biotin/lipoyl-containing protein [Candidatus Limnocylindria bacterium]